MCFGSLPKSQIHSRVRNAANTEQIPEHLTVLGMQRVVSTCPESGTGGHSHRGVPQRSGEAGHVGHGHYCEESFGDFGNFP